jgi:hypothetical protein
VLVKIMREGYPLPKTPFLESNPALHDLRFTLEKCLFGADRRVAAQAKKWGMNFMAVSDLNGRNVPF